MKLKFIKRLLVLSLAFLFVLNTSIIFAEDKINIPKSIQIYYTAADAKNRVNSKGYWSAGDYYIFTKYDGMINISYSNSEPGAWINPNDIGSNSDIVITPNIPILRIETQINRYSSFVVYSDMKAYRSASDAYKSTNPVTTLSSGIYYVLSASNNMLEISSTKSNSGYWINPARNSGFYKTANDYTTWDFINEIGPLAQKLAAENDLYASVMMAQAILESGWGNSLLANKPFHNLFGVKGSYNGDSILIKTFEYTNGGSRYDVLSNFRKYPSYMESLKDYVYVLTGDDDPSSWNYKFYLGVRKSRTSNYREATNYLTGRYATSPAYANSLNSLIENYNLTKFDTEAEKLGPVVSGYITRSYNLRDGASLNSKIVGLLKAGTYVKGNTVGDFIKLSNGKYVYHGKLLNELKNVSGYFKSDAIVAKNPGLSAIKTLKKDTFIQGKSLGDWIILSDGNYVENKGLSDLPSTATKVSGYLRLTMNVRKSPSTDSAIIGYKSAGEYIEGYLYKGWIKLSNGNYIHESGLSNYEESNSSTQGIKVYGNIIQTMNVRKSPSTNSAIVGNKYAGDYIEGYLNNGWIKLADGNYIHKSALSASDLEVESSFNGTKVTGYLTSTMNIRRSPSINSVIVGYKSAGQYIEGYLNNGWIKLADGNYMYQSGLSDKDLAGESIFEGTKISGYLNATMNIRKSPSTNSAIVGNKYAGDYIEGYLNNGWIKLTDGNYVHESGLSKINPSSSLNSSSTTNYDESSTTSNLVTDGVKISGNLIQTMNIRKLPNIDANIVGSKYEGEYIEGYLNGEWIKISEENYINQSALSDKDLSNAINSQGKKVSGNIIQTMNVRKSSSIASEIVGYKFAGEYIEGYLNNGWIKLSDDNYIHESALYR